MILRVIINIIAIAGIAFMIKRNQTRALKSYIAYYAEKRREFPYLNDWLNNLEQKNINVAEIRSKASAGGGKWLPIIVAVAIVVLASIFFGNNIIVLLISVAVALLTIELIGRRSSKNPGDDSNGMEYGLSLECPSCHCPHSWKLLRKEVHYLSYKMENNKFTEKGEKVTTYDTKEWRDFKCSNCGHTDQTETTAQEVWIENKAEQKTAPDDYVKNYNPPLPAWNPKDVINERKKEEQREQEIADYRERKQQEKEEQQQEKEQQKKNEQESAQWTEENKEQIGDYKGLKEQASQFEKKKDYGNAVKVYKEMLIKCPDYTSSINILLSEAYFNNNMYDEAIKVCDELLENKDRLYGSQAINIQKLRDKALKKKG